MHYADIETAESLTCQQFKTEIHRITKVGYKKETAVALVNDAIQRAKIGDKNIGHFMSANKTTKVYQLVEALLEKMKLP